MFLRNVAKCWREDKRKNQEVIDCINQFKKSVNEYETFQNIWQNLVALDDAAVTKVQKNFLVMLSRNGKHNIRIRYK